MTTTTSSPAVPAPAFTLSSAWPQVDLLPPEVRVKRRLKGTKRKLLLVVALVVLVVLGGYVAALLSARSAQSELESVQKDTVTLQAEQGKYSEVPRLLGSIASVEAARHAGTATEILWKPYLDALRAVTPAGVSLDSFVVATTTPKSVAQPLVASSVGSLAAPSIGQVTFTARSLTVPNTSDWMAALNSVPGFADAWFSAATLTAADGGAYWQLSATVQVNSQALANRFAVGGGK